MIVVAVFYNVFNVKSYVKYQWYCVAKCQNVDTCVAYNQMAYNHYSLVIKSLCMYIFKNTLYVFSCCLFSYPSYPPGCMTGKLHV